MSVLRNMFGRMASRLDEVARHWLPRQVAGDAERDTELAVVRAVAAIALVALPGVPLILSVVLPVSLALPVGVGLVAAASLFSLVAGIAYRRRALSFEQANGPANGQVSGPVIDVAALYDRFAGLVTLHDVRGSVTGVHGRDAGDFRSWMRDPTGRGFIDQIHVSDRILFLQAIDLLRQGSALTTIDLRLERPNGLSQNGLSVGEQFVHLRCEMTAVRDDARPLSILVQSRDVSQEALLRADTARKAERAESANDAKTRFLAAVSHELRTPLNAILGFSDILTGEYFGKLENDRQREYVTLINQSGLHLLAVVNAMLDMSKIEAGRYELLPEPFMVAKVVKACEAMLGLQAQTKGVSLTSRIMRNVGEVNADQRALQQILINLVGNAIKFTERGGLVTIDAETVGANLKLTVSDTGIGIAENKLGLIGQPFMQIESDYSRRHEGTGLGLSLVKGLVALHGGSFAIASRPGEGTVITVTIPLDGSGIETLDESDSPADTMVEFPPRLKERDRDAAGESLVAAPVSRMTPERSTPESRGPERTAQETGGAGHDDKQAKTA